MNDAKIRSEIVKLERMKAPELQRLYREYFGEDAKTGHPKLLRRQIAYRLQEQAYGRLDEGCPSTGDSDWQNSAVTPQPTV